MNKNDHQFIIKEIINSMLSDQSVDILEECYKIGLNGALSSGGERLLHTQEVTGSNPVAPTINEVLAEGAIVSILFP
jgi:hypothetical protein